MQKPQISSVEVFSVIVSLVLGLTPFNVVPFIIRGAGQSIWLSVIAALPVSLAFGYSFYFLQRRYPGKTLFEQALIILGPIGGKAFNLLWSVMFLHAAALSIRNLSAFFRIFMTETPNGAFVILFVTVAAAGAALGVEVILRSSIILSSTALLVFGLSMALLLNKADPGHLLPLLPQGLLPPLISAGSILVWLNMSAISGVLLAYHPKPARAWRAHVLGLVGSSVTVLGLLLLTVATLGPYFAATQQAPFYSAMRLVEVGRFIENMELLLVTSNMASGLVTYAILLYVARVGFGLVFGVKEAPSLSWPLAAVVGVFSLGLGTSRSEITLFFVRVLPVYATLVPYGSMLILVIASLWRKQPKAQSQKG